MRYCFVMIWVLFSALSWSQAEETPAYATGGPQRCLICHGDAAEKSATGILESVHGVVGNPNTPFGSNHHDCQTCHGPSAAHLSLNPDGSRPAPAIVFNREERFQEQNTQEANAVCLSCHQKKIGLHWAGSRHQFEEVACSNCHQLHTATDPVLQQTTQGEVCFNCHRRERADFFRPSAHPIKEQLMDCADCHQAHGGEGPFLLATPTANDTCFQCHAEKRGPFLWEHAPVQEDCGNCHTPHGSNHNAMLVARSPWLCQQCHLVQFHPSTALSGTGVPPLGASSSILGKDCMNCHNAVHGSNHPSGNRLIR